MQRVCRAFGLARSTAHVFVAVDRCTYECVGLHAARSGNRFEALEPLRQGVREHFGGFDRDIAAGLAIRHDHGSAYMSHDFRRELTFLGMAGSPSSVREPEGSGCAERFIRTLEENLLWVRTVAESVQALGEFKRTYNERRPIGRHGRRPPDPACVTDRALNKPAPGADLLSRNRRRRPRRPGSCSGRARS
jgi:transposase InsO family protein